MESISASGADVTPYVDWSKARRPGREVQRVNVDFPVDLLREIEWASASHGFRPIIDEQARPLRSATSHA